jgi:Mg-chelatase subunit ChlD
VQETKAGLNPSKGKPMKQLMRCLYCGLLQDEPVGVKECARCGGELAYENQPTRIKGDSYVLAQLELDQVQAPSGRNIDRYLLATLVTPSVVPAEHAASKTAGRPPINLTVVLDNSGSMAGGKLQQAKEAIRQSLQYLVEGDSLSLVIFSSTVRCVLEPTPINSHVRRTVESALDEIGPTGMTALDGGLEMGIERCLARPRTTNLVMLLSDGQANVGETDLEKVGQRAWGGRQKGLAVSTLGIGADYNEALMSEIANQGGGRFYHLSEAAQIPRYLTGELGEAAMVAARQAVIELELPTGAALIPLSATYPAEQVNGKVRVLIGDIACDQELEIPLRLTLYAQPAGARFSVTGQVLYSSPASHPLASYFNRVTVRFVAPESFELRQGLALPVAEKVMPHLRASYVLGINRLAAIDPDRARKFADQDAETLRIYAKLLGDDQAVVMEEDLTTSLNMFAASPVQAKRRVHEAHAVGRRLRDFLKDDH